MKLKYPKSIRIGSIIWKIKYLKNQDSGSFDFNTEIIKIGLKGCKTRVFEIFIHEVKEIIQCEQDVRFMKREYNNYVFLYDHQHHTDLCSRLAGAIDQFIK